MAHRHRALRAVPIILILALIGAWSVFLYTFGAEQLVAAISVKNGYILAFFVAVFGGISSLTSTSFYLTIITLAVGGLNPLLLGIVGGAGVTVGDSLFYYLGSRSRQLLSGRMREQVERFPAGWGQNPTGRSLSACIFIAALHFCPTTYWRLRWRWRDSRFAKRRSRSFSGT